MSYNPTEQDRRIAKAIETVLVDNGIRLVTNCEGAIEFIHQDEPKRHVELHGMNRFNAVVEPWCYDEN